MSYITDLSHKPLKDTQEPKAMYMYTDERHSPHMVYICKNPSRGTFIFQESSQINKL